MAACFLECVDHIEYAVAFAGSEVVNGNAVVVSQFLDGFYMAACQVYHVDVVTYACSVRCIVVITKYTGARGKSGTNDASAEFMHYVRDLLDRTGVIWQTGELGAVDQGGGGTVAMFVAHMNVEVVDVGVPVLSMHAPFELVSKTDVYMTYRAFVEFLKA